MITKDGGVVKDFIELDLKEFDDDGFGESNSDELTPEELIEKEVFDAVSLGSLYYLCICCCPIYSLAKLSFLTFTVLLR